MSFCAQPAAQTASMVTIAFKSLSNDVRQRAFWCRFMQNWLMTNLSKAESSGMSEQQKKSLEKALNQILSKQSITPAYPMMKSWVERRRQKLHTKRYCHYGTGRYHQHSCSLRQRRNHTCFFFSSMGGVQSHLLFRRKTGGALKEPINFILYQRGLHLPKSRLLWSSRQNSF